MTLVSIKPHGVGLGALLDLYARLLNRCKETGETPCFNYKQLAYFSGCEISPRDLEKQFDFGIQLGETKNTLPARELLKFRNNVDLQKIIKIKKTDDFITGFNVAIHARFGHYELQKNKDKKAFIENKNCLNSRVVPKERFWEAMGKFPTARFFIASDNPNFIAETQTRFFARCVHYANAQENLIHTSPKQPMQALREALRDIYTLAAGQVLICNKSAFNLYAQRKTKPIVLLP